MNFPELYRMSVPSGACAFMSMRFLLAGYATAILAVMLSCAIAGRGVRRMRGLNWLMAALGSAFVGVVLIAARSHISNFFSIVVANVFIFGYYALLHQALADLLERDLRVRRLGLGLAVFLAGAFYLYGCHTDQLQVRIVIVCAVVAIQAGASLILVLGHEDEALRYQLRSVGSLLLAVLVFQVGRAIITLVWSPGSDFLQPNQLHAFMGFLYCILALAIVGAIIWLGVSLQQRELERLANTDALTGLLNRRAFDRIVKQELAGAMLEPESVCLVLLDLDYFKSINDTHGHQVGDEVIRQVGRLLGACTRSTDYVARYGGEEFAMLLTRINRPRAEAAAERLRCAISSISGLPEEIHTTASFGIAMNRAGENLHSFFARSDEALYLSKRSGRNRVQVHTGLLKPALVYTES